jgi:hypothetical protein
MTATRVVRSGGIFGHYVVEREILHRRDLHPTSNGS